MNEGMLLTVAGLVIGVLAVVLAATGPVRDDFKRLGGSLRRSRPAVVTSPPSPTGDPRAHETARVGANSGQLTQSQVALLLVFRSRAGRPAIRRKFQIVSRGGRKYARLQDIELPVDATDDELRGLHVLGYLDLYSSPPAMAFTSQALADISSAAAWTRSQEGAPNDRPGAGD